MNSTQAKQIQIENFLDKLNHSPVKESGSDLWKNIKNTHMNSGFPTTKSAFYHCYFS